uniref:Minor tail protein n=1 Tax=Microbacterium phage Judebell TaxID=3230835 RepID=A0AAU8EFW8_9CAUD
MSAAQVLSIIASLHGGHNGEVRDRQIGVEITGDTTAIYSLIHWNTEADAPVVPRVEERYALTLVPLPDLPVDPEETAARGDELPSLD